MSVLGDFDNYQWRCRGAKAAAEAEEAELVLQQNALEVVGMSDQGK